MMPMGYCIKNLGGLLPRNITWKASNMFSSFMSGSALTISSDPTQTGIKGLPEALNVLKDSYKIRINQTKIHRIGLKSPKKECVREFEVVDTLKDNKKLLFIRLDYSMKIGKYQMSTFAYPFKDGGEPEGPCLIKLDLERIITLKLVAARLSSPPEQPIAYIYDLKGPRRTAILENRDGNKCLYQFQTDNPRGWASEGKIYSGRGNARLGHFSRVTEGYHKEEKMIYVRLYPKMDIPSKCIIIGAALYLMSYDYLL